MKLVSRSGAAGGLRAILVCLALSFIAGVGGQAWAGGGIKDPQIDPRVANAISSYKLRFGYPTSAAFVAARTAECVSRGVVCDSLVEGLMFYDTTTDEIKIYDGALWQPYAPGAGAGLSLDDAYTNGATIDRDLTAVKIVDTKADNLNSFWVARTGGTGPAINIDNTSTGNDITGDLWSVSTNGLITATGLDMADSQSVVLGTGDDATLVWDGTSLVLTPAAANQEVDFGTDGVGWDLQLHTGTAGDFFRFDASDKMLYSVDGFFKLGDADVFYFGNGSGGAAAVDGDFAISSDGTNLNIIPEVAGTNGVVFGTDGNGVDVTLYGDGAGSSLMWDYGVAPGQDALILTSGGAGVPAYIQITDSAVGGATAGLTFGSGADASGDIGVNYIGGATNELRVTQTALGTGAIVWGQNDEGMQQTFHGDTAANNLLIDAANDACTLTSWDIHYDDNSTEIWGSGAGAAGDMVWQYLAGTNVLQLSQTVPGVGADGTGVVVFGPDGEGFDVIFRGETAGDEMRWDNDLDGGAGGALSGLVFTNGTVLNGDAQFSITMGATNAPVPADGTVISAVAANRLDIDSVAGGGIVYIGANTDTDFQIQSAGGTYTVDYGLDLMTIDAADLQINDDDFEQFGDTADLLMSWDVTTYAGGVPWGAGGQTEVFHVTQLAPDSMIVWGVDGAGINQVWPTDTAGAFVYLNQTGDELELDQVDVQLGNDDYAIYGDGAAGAGDIRVSYDVTTYAGGGALPDGEVAALHVEDVAAGHNAVVWGVDTAGLTQYWWGTGPLERMQWDANTGAGTAALRFNWGADLVGDLNFNLILGATNTETPLDGFQLLATANDFYIDPMNGLAANTIWIGFDGAAAEDVDTVWYGASGGVDAPQMAFDYGTNSLQFVDLGSIFMSDDRPVGFGNAVAAPDMLTYWNSVASEFFLDTGGVANATYRIGTAAANHQIDVEFGDAAVAAIEIDPNAAPGQQIEYLTQPPLQELFLTAGNFTAGYPNHDPQNGAAADVYQGRLGTATMGGWVMTVNDASDDEIETYWVPDHWVDGSKNIGARIVWYTDTDEGACILSWKLCYYALDVLSAPGVRTLASQALTCVETDFTYNAGSAAYEIERTTALTIPSAAVVPPVPGVQHSITPIVFQIKHDDDDTHETCTADVVVLGLELGVYRQYGD